MKLAGMGWVVDKNLGALSEVFLENPTLMVLVVAVIVCTE